MEHQNKIASLEETLLYSIEVEQAIIASMLVDKEALVRIVDDLMIEDFYYDVHRLIVKSTIELYSQDEPVDLITLNNKLKANDSFKKAGASAYLDKIVNVIPTSANIEYYLKIIKEKAQLRHLVKVCNNIIKDVYQKEDDVDSLIDKAESKIFEIAHKSIRTDFISIKPALANTLDSIELLYHNKDETTGVPSRFFDLDKLTGGFQPSDLIILAARPSMGKTALVLNITENISLNHNKGIAIFSLEMSKNQLCQRLISSNSKVDSQKIRTGKFDKSDFPKIADAVNKLSKTRIFIDDTPSITTLEIRAKARRLIAKEAINLIIIDYLQLIATSSARRQDNRQNEIAEISRSIKTLARELDIPIIALSQLSRQVEVRGGDHRPRLSDLRDSGALEQDADLVMFIYRDEYYYPDDENAKGTAELIVAKQRNGPTGVVKLLFNSTLARFNNLSTEY